MGWAARLGEHSPVGRASAMCWPAEWMARASQEKKLGVKSASRL